MNEKEIAVMFRKGILVLGGVLVVAGAVLLMYFGVLVYQIVHRPHDVALVQYSMELVQNGDRTIYGTMGGKPLEINVSESARRHTFLFIGVLVLAVLAGILKSIISSGVELISYGLGKRPWLYSPSQEPSRPEVVQTPPAEE